MDVFLGLCPWFLCLWHWRCKPTPWTCPFCPWPWGMSLLALLDSDSWTLLILTFHCLTSETSHFVVDRLHAINTVISCEVYIGWSYSSVCIIIRNYRSEYNVLPPYITSLPSLPTLKPHLNTKSSATKLHSLPCIGSVCVVCSHSQWVNVPIFVILCTTRWPSST